MKTNGELKNLALNDLKDNWKQPILITIVYLVISLIASSLNEVKDVSIILPLSGFLLTLLIVGPLGYAYTQLMLDFVRNEKEEMINKLFNVFSNYKRAFLTYFMVSLYILLWTLLLIVPGIIKALSYSMTYYIAKDNPEYSVDECIEESKKMMDGYKGRIFVLQLSFLGWILLSILTLGIGFIWLIPYMHATKAHFYEERCREMGIAVENTQQGATGEMIETAKPAEDVCPMCGTPTPTTGKFCPNCGYEQKR